MFAELSDLMKNGGVNVLDVRKNGEYDAEHVEDATHFPLDYINDNIDSLDKSKKYHVHCKSGYRSIAAISIMEEAGFDVVDVKGGMDAILESDIPVTDFACQD